MSPTLLSRRTAAPISRRGSVFILGTSLLPAVFCLLALWLAPAAWAQTAHFAGAQTTFPVSGLNSPYDVAVDSSGNVYISDHSNGRVLRETPAADGAWMQTTVGSGLGGPAGVAVDGGGNVYIADDNNRQVLKESPSGGGYTQTVVADSTNNGLVYPVGVAVDGSGNVYVADAHFTSVFKETPSGGSYIQSTIGSGLNNPTAVAVDGSGNLYIADNLNNRVLLETLSGGSYAQTTIPSIGLNEPNGVAVDGSGNVYIADTTNNRVLLETLSGGSYTQTTIASGLNGPQGIAVAGNGNVYIADNQNDRVVELQFAGINVNSSDVGTATASIPLTFTFDRGTLGALPQVLTGGGPNLDFTDAGTGTCTANGSPHIYNAGDTCTVDVVFTPKFAGTRYAAVVLEDSDGNTIATAYIYGMGIGPQIAFSPAAQSAIGSGFNGPGGIAVDGGGNVYIADTFNNRVLKETLSQGSYMQTAIGSGLITPAALAVDGAGNVYIADAGHDNVVKETLSGGSYTQTAIISSGLHIPEGVAVDGGGNVYVADSLNNRVLKLTLSGSGAYQAATVVSGGLYQPYGVAVDAMGNLYLADTMNNRVLKETLSNGTFTETTVGSGFSMPSDLALDASGNLYIADSNNNRVVEITTSGTQTTIGSGLNYPDGVAVDGSGNIYIADFYNNRGLVENVVNPPSLSFATTAVGAISSDSPQTITVSNNGTAALTFTVPLTGMNPSVSTNFTYSNSSTCPELDTGSPAATLAAGASCIQMASFSPTTVGAPVTGSLVTADNNLNSPSAVQTVSLSGTATQATQTITFPQPASVTYGAGAATLTAAASSGLPVSYVVTSGPATVNGSTLNVTAAGPLVVTASQLGNANYAAATPVPLTIMVNPATTSTALTSSAGAITAGQSVTFTATVSSAAGVPSGTVTFLNGATVLGTVPLNASGVATFTATALPVAGDPSFSASYATTTDFAASTSATVLVMVSAPPTPPPSFTVASAAASLTVIQGQNARVVLTLTPAGGYSGTVTFSCQGLPANAACVFAPASTSLTGSNQAVSVALTIDTNVQQARISPVSRPGQSPLNPVLPALAFWFPGSLAGLAAFGRKRKFFSKAGQLCLLLAVTGALMTGLSGCGSSKSSGANGMTPIGSSTVTVVATGTSASGVITQNAVLTVAITN